MADGTSCVATVDLPCDDATTFGASTNVSREPDSLVESDTVVAADGKGTVVVAWSKIPVSGGGPRQVNRLGVSHDDGATWKLLAAPTDAPTSAQNDSALRWDNGTFFYVWEGYESNFGGAQHVFLSTSTDGDTWSAAMRVDTEGDFQSGGALDFPWLAVHPITHELFVTYQVVTQTTAEERIVVGDATGAFSASTRFNATPGSFPDLARTAFDGAGNFYAAWLDGGDPGAAFGGVLSGAAGNHIFVNRIDVGADGGVTTVDGGAMTAPHATLAADVQLDKGEAVAIEAPAIAVTHDGSRVYVAYVTGKKGAVDIVVRTSSDRGATWSAPVTVNDDGTCATHFHPAMVLDEKENLHVFWYDNRDGAGHFFHATSTDGGKTFSPNRLVSRPAFPFDTFQYSTGWLGDYFEPAVAGGKIYVTWSDGREGDQSHAFFAKGIE
jgi:hypothetical protein